MEIIQSILTKHPCYRAGKKITVKGLMLHSVGCPQPGAEVFVRSWNNPEHRRACVHAFIDGNTGTVYQTLPWDHRAWHCGSGAKGSGNNTHIGVEMCEPACIRYTGGTTFTCSDKEAAVAVVKRTYEAAVELFAYLCRQYGLNPLADGVIISHREGHERGIASGHGDPEHLWNGLGCGYSMDTFRQAVSAKMENFKEPSGQSEGTVIPQQTADHETIRAGCVVGIAAAAVYYNGKGMPAWVKKDKWIVKSVNGERVVIDKNVSGSASIMSPVHIRYLVMEGHKIPAVGNAGQGFSTVGNSEQGASAAGNAGQGSSIGGNAEPESSAEAEERVQPSPAAVTAGAMEISEKGVELIARYEGCRLQAYKCPAGVWTIGYGHTDGVKEGDTLPSEEYAKKLLKEDLAKYAAGGGKVLAGLVKRREEEKMLFLSERRK